MSPFVYSKQENDFCRKYLVTGERPEPSGLEALLFPVRFNAMQDNLVERLMFYDGIAMSVYGENVPLTILINLFSLKSVEALIEQRAIEFVLQTSAVMSIESEVPGVSPLGSGKFDSSAHCDPEESAYTGLGWMSTKLPKKIRRSVAKKVASCYKTPAANLAEDAVAFAYSGHKAGIFHTIGLPADKGLDKFNIHERRRLCSMANGAFETAIMALNGYDAIEMPEVNQVLSNQAARAAMSRTRSIAEGASNIFQIENVPRFSQLVRMGLLTAAQIPVLRASNDATRFREWLGSCSQKMDAAGYSAEYVDAVAKKSGFWSTNRGRIARAVGITAISTGLGTALDGATGGVVGALAGAGLDLGINALDSMVLDKFTRGWTPKSFIDAIKAQTALKDLHLKQ